MAENKKDSVSKSDGKGFFSRRPYSNSLNSSLNYAGVDGTMDAQSVEGEKDTQSQCLSLQPHVSESSFRSDSVKLLGER
jgi:hypothetical protein